MIVPAKYSNQNLLPQYRGNPLIECLPPILSPNDVVKVLANPLSIDFRASLQYPPHIRLHAIAALEELYVPHPSMIAFESELGITLRRGLLGRHPFSPDTQRYLDDVRDQIRKTLHDQFAFVDPLAGCIMLTALSGSGKTRGIRSVLKTYPQVISHSEYYGRPLIQKQIVWLSVNAPVSGSIRGLLLRLFHALDEALGKSGKDTYLRQFGRTRMAHDIQIEHFAQAAASHFVGVIHIDDLQRVPEARKGEREKIYNFIIQLANSARIPLVLSGTPPMTQLLAGSFEAARRAISGATIDLKLPKDESDAFFKALLNALLRYQWTDVPFSPTEEQRKAIFRWTLGIAGVMVYLHAAANKLALREGAKEMTFVHYERAYKSLYVLHPALNVLRSGRKGAMLKYVDLMPNLAQMIKGLKNLNGEEFDVEDLMVEALAEI